MSKGRPPSPRTTFRRRLVRRHERLWLAVLLSLHAVLAVWGAARQSVTFDENYHLPAGVMAVTRGDMLVSVVNPPLVKMLCALPALAVGARVPTQMPRSYRVQDAVGEAFMRVNADRYHRVFLAGRLVIVGLSLLLGWLVWRWARRLYGATGGLLALGLYVVCSETLAHAGVVTMDLATALGFFGSTVAFWAFTRTGRWKWWCWAAAAVAFTALTRFSAVLLLPVLLGLAALLHRVAPRPRLVWLGLLLLIPTTVVLINTGYLFQTSWKRLDQMELHSSAFRGFQRVAPAARLPLPDAYLIGFDWQTFEGEDPQAMSYLMGRIHTGPVRQYFPLAILFKWPLGLLLALATRAVLTAWSGGWRKRWRDEAVLFLPVVVVLGIAMLGSNLNAGVRYVLPILPFLMVWAGGLAAIPPRRGAPGAGWRRALTVLAVALPALEAAETLRAAPWYLSFFNLAAGGPGGGYRLVNDSNVDWGQGLIALRDEMEKRGIRRIHLTYHGTTDPAIYGIDYVPFLGGTPGPESDWLAVSSYFYVGLSQRMMVRTGLTVPVKIDFSGLNVPPAAEPAGCMFLFRMGWSGAGSTAGPPPADSVRARPGG
jgi:hypothetical protein